MIRLDSHVTSQLDSHEVTSRKSTSGMTNRQQGKRFVLIRSNRQHFQPTLKVRINYIFQVSRKSTSGMSNRQKGKQFVLIQWNRIHESISGLSNRKYQRRINSSWEYWTTLQSKPIFASHRCLHYHSDYHCSQCKKWSFTASQLPLLPLPLPLFPMQEAGSGPS